jgi:hypothetical protein
MKKTKTIRFVESFIILPIMTSMMPFGVLPGGPLIQPHVVVAPQAQSIDSTLKLEADAIDNYFAKGDMPLEGMGMKMAVEAEKNDLDWRLLPAIAMRESTGGKFDCNNNKHNFFGWGSCRIGFKSDDEAIEIVAKNLGGNNSATAIHYNNKTTLQILHAYNPPSIVPRYAEQVMAIMDAIGPADTTATAKTSKTNNTANI